MPILHNVWNEMVKEYSMETVKKANKMGKGNLFWLVSCYMLIPMLDYFKLLLLQNPCQLSVLFFIEV